jgi:Uma2 family endonuclease
MVLVPGTLRLDAFTMVDPDIVWVPAPFGTPHHERPKPLVVVEVSHTTYKRDSGIKLRHYAYFGIRDYWILHLKKHRIEVYRNPQNPTGQLGDCTYASVEKYVKGQSIALLDRPEVSFLVDDLLP